MKILYVAPHDPRLTKQGNHQRTNFLWQALKSLGEVYTIVMGSAPNGTSVINEDKIFFIDPQLQKNMKSLKGLGYKIMDYLTGFSYLPYKLPCNQSVLDFVSNNNFDIVVCRYIKYLSKYHFWNIAPTFVDIDDNPLQVYDTITCKRFSPIFRPFCKQLAILQYKSLLKRVSGGWIANKDHASTQYNVSFLPNISLQPSESYNPNELSRDYLFTIGLMSYQPNYEGVLRFLTEVWPHLHKEFPNIKYVIGGKGAPDVLAEKCNSTLGVEYVGFVEDIENTYQHCIATVVPIHSGSGTCIKTLESIAFSRICLATPFGARGLENDIKVKETGIFVFEDKDEFLHLFRKIIQERKENNFEQKARKFYEDNFSFVVFKDIVCSKLSNTKFDE